MKRQIIDTIEKYDKIIIHRHVRPDPDAYGSQIGLKELIKANYPDKKVYAAGKHEESLTYLAVPDQVERSIYEDALVIVTDTGNTERIDGEFYTEGALLMKIDHHPDADPYGDIKWVDTSCKFDIRNDLLHYLKKEKRNLWVENAKCCSTASICRDCWRYWTIYVSQVPQ